MDQQSIDRNEIIDYILRGNAMMRRHAEERHSLLKQIIALINQMENGKSSMVNQAINEAATIQNEIDNLENQIIEDADTQLYFKLMHLNKMSKLLDQKADHRKDLISDIMQLDANLLARDELIDILQEYIDLETASSHRTLSDLSEAQSKIEEYNNQLDTYEKLSRHDPRFKALEILNSHPEGMSMTQLSFMLGTSQYEAYKVIQDLISFEMIERRGDSELIHAIQQFQSEITIDDISREIIEKQITK